MTYFFVQYLSPIYPEAWLGLGNPVLIPNPDPDKISV